MPSAKSTGYFASFMGSQWNGGSAPSDQPPNGGSGRPPNGPVPPPMPSPHRPPDPSPVDPSIVPPMPGTPGGHGPPDGGDSGPPSDPHGGHYPPYPYYSSTKTFRMKPDISLFPVLNDDGKFPSFFRKLMAVMRGTDMGELLEEDYTPSPSEQASYRNKRLWLYTILDRNVHTTEGRDILERHRRSSDGLWVLSDLYAHATRSTASQLRARTLMDKLVNEKLTRAWNKPIVEYISWFLRTVNSYNELMLSETQMLSPDMIRTMLERNIVDAKPLAAVRNQELFNIAQGGAPLTLDQYLSLLKSAAALMDVQRDLRPTPARPARQRRANEHDLVGSGDDDHTSVASSPNDDVAALDAFMAAQRVPGSSMNRDTWNSLDKATHSAWDLISPEDKAKILSYAEERATRRAAASDTTRPARLANVADSTPDTPPTSGEGAGLTVEANVADSTEEPTKQSVHPADIRRVMASGTKKPSVSQKPSAAAGREGNVVRWQVRTADITPSDEWGGLEQASSSDSVPPFQFSDSPASPSSGVLDEMDMWAAASTPSTATPELESWGQDTVSLPSSTQSLYRDPFDFSQHWADEDNQLHFC